MSEYNHYDALRHVAGLNAKRSVAKPKPSLLQLVFKLAGWRA